MKRWTPQRFMCQTPMYEIKLVATIKPNNAGYQSPIFFIAGENTDGKLKTIQIKPRIQTILIRVGRFMDACIFTYYVFNELQICVLFAHKFTCYK